MTESETVKTVVEGGATIQVTSHNISDSDEEDGNVYNVKVILASNTSFILWFPHTGYCLGNNFKLSPTDIQTCHYIIISHSVVLL